MYWRVIDVRFYASVVEDLSAVHVDDMLQMRKKNNKHFFIFFLGLFVVVVLFCFLHAFAYVFDMGLTSKFVVDNET